MHFIGCDVAKLTLDLAGCDPRQASRTRTCSVANDPAGWQQLTRWLEQHWPGNRSRIGVVMEATGVYHNRVAQYLHAAGFKVMVCNPGRATDYARSQNRLNKTDGLDARSLQRYGARLEQIRWFEPNLPDIDHLKALLALLWQLEKDIRRWTNRREKACFEPAGMTVRSPIERQIRNLKRERDRTQAAIDDLIASSEALTRDQQLMCSIQGVGPKTSQSLLPLLHNTRFASARQAAAFIGLTPRHRQSGTSLNAPGRLSGRGDPRLRAKLYLPALTAMKWNPELKAFYASLINRGKSPKQAITAVMRKLVHLCYGVVKNQTPYRTDYGCLP